jgi:hypothetical protein
MVNISPVISEISEIDKSIFSNVGQICLPQFLKMPKPRAFPSKLVVISEERGDLESLKAYGQRPSDVNSSHGPLIQMS